MSAIDVRRAHVASWADVVDAATENFSSGYDLGFAQGYAAAQEDAQAHARQVDAARSAADHLDVHLARRKAAGRWSV